MPSDLLTPFLELDEEFCKTFRGLEVTEAAPSSSQRQRVLGFQRRHSLCPVTLPNSKFNGGEAADWGAGLCAAAQWRREGQLPRCPFSHIPFRMDRSVSMIEGGAKHQEKPLPPPPPGLGAAAAAAAASRATAAPHISTRYKTELCRTFEESGACKYGAKCQFAHGLDELRGLSRHPKYKTEPCRTFHTIGFCPYGARCHFIHNADELLSAAEPGARAKPPLRHSLSFAGFSSPAQSFRPADEPSSLVFARAASVSPPPSSAGSPELLSPLFPEAGALKHCPYPFSAVPDLHADDPALRFYAAADSYVCPALTPKTLPFGPARKPPPPPPPPPCGLQRCSSADSLSEEGYTSSCSLSSASSGAESPSFEGRRLPIFSRLSVSDE